MNDPKRTNALFIINKGLNEALEECKKFESPEFKDFAEKIDKILIEVAEMVLKETGAEIKTLKED